MAAPQAVEIGEVRHLSMVGTLTRSCVGMSRTLRISCSGRLLPSVIEIRGRYVTFMMDRKAYCNLR